MMVIDNRPAQAERPNIDMAIDADVMMVREYFAETLGWNGTN
jgi:hypothetical protein